MNTKKRQMVYQPQSMSLHADLSLQSHSVPKMQMTKGTVLHPYSTQTRFWFGSNYRHMLGMLHSYILFQQFEAAWHKTCPAAKVILQQCRQYTLVNNAWCSQHNRPWENLVSTGKAALLWYQWLSNSGQRWKKTSTFWSGSTVTTLTAVSCFGFTFSSL